MIASFGDGVTEALFHHGAGPDVRKLPASILRVALRKLDLINNARELSDLASPPGNRLEALRGPLTGYHSIRINDQWRVVFR